MLKLRTWAAAALPLALLATAGLGRARGQVMDFPDWMTALGDKIRSMGRLSPQDFNIAREKVIQEILEWGVLLPAADMKYPYYAFVPNYDTTLPWNGSEVALSSTCFKEIKASLKQGSPPRVHISASAPNSKGCSELYMFATVSSLRVARVAAAGEQSFSWDVPRDVTESEQWDLKAKGVRAFRFTTNIKQTLSSIYQTALLFEPVLTQGVNRRADERNAAFLRDYAAVDLKPRDARENVALNESDVRSGDMFQVVRFDGLDPMLAWGMGSTTGHVTTALRIKGELFVVESQVKSSYWPTDNIQRTPFAKWVQQAQKAGYNVVHVPLSEEARADYDEEAALAYFESVEGFQYGYPNLLWGWVDTLKDNYPCLPPDYTRCLDWELIEVAFGLVDRHFPSIAQMLWTESFNLRLGTQGLNTPQLWQAAANRNMSTQEVPALVEQDKWEYHLTRHDKDTPAVGPSMVCCVFVCNMWKAAGVFGHLADDINCAELTNSDDYYLKIFRGDYAQILGSRTMFLPHLNTQAPYAHMYERCPGLPPTYARPEGC